MSMRPGRHSFSAEQSRLTLRTSRDGLAAQAGHDLMIDVQRWSGELIVTADGTPENLDVHADLGSIVVRSGTGGIKPLTDRDKREIVATARKVLHAERYPEATFTASRFVPDPSGNGGAIEGTLALAGQTQPQRLRVTAEGQGRFRAATTVRQTSYGIKPYSGFLGALRVSDTVEVEAEVDLSAAVLPPRQSSAENPESGG
jgi:polyisoprenoid-binding protein YceI